MKILYVDDDADIREVAELSLQMDPEVEVRVAGSGVEALAVLETFPAEAVLLDVMMPGMDGPALLSAIRARGGEMSPKALFVTARAVPAEVEALTGLGASGVITKPFDPLTFAAEVRRLLDAA